MTISLIALESPYVSGWPENDDDRAGLVPLNELLTERYDTDVHFTAYSSDVERRHTNASVGKAPITMHVAVFDVDGPDHKADDDWWEGERMKLDDLPPRGFIYRTRGGYRIVYRLPEPVAIKTPADAAHWTAQYLGWCRYLGALGIQADLSCKTWTRLFRAPHTTRDGVLQELKTIGDPTNIGVWDVFVDAVEDEPPAPPPAPPPVKGDLSARRLGAAKMLGAVWPKSGRHQAQLALAGGLAQDGWAKESALDFLCAVCREAGNEDPGKRRQTIEDTWKAKERGGVAGWEALKRHVDGVVVDNVRATVHPEAEALAQFKAAGVTASAPPPAPPPGADEFGIKWGGWDAPQMPPVYLLQGLIPEAKVVTFFAEGGSVKTWSALALAIAVATGQPWLGAYAVKPGKALYLDYEDGPYEFHRRVRYLTGGQDVPTLGYRYVGRTIDSEKFWHELTCLVESQGISLVVIDSISAAMPGDIDENSSKFPEGVKHAGKFTETGCTVVFIHHANKSGGIRGFSGVRDQSDIVFKFEPVSENDDGVKRMRMVCDKPGPQRKPAPVNVELNNEGLTTFEDEVHEAGRNAATTVDIEGAVRLAISNNPGMRNLPKVREKTGLNQNDVANALKSLCQSGEVVKLDSGYAIDSDGFRRERVLGLLDSGLPVSTAGDIAKHAFVDTRLVDRMRIEGIICQSAEGRWIRVAR